MQSLTRDLLYRILAADPAAVVVLDAHTDDLRVVWVSPAYQRLTGYSAESVTGRQFVISQITDEPGSLKVRSALQRRESVDAVVRDVRFDGSVYWNQMSVRPILDTDGGVSHLAVYCRDATEHLQMRDEVARHWRELRSAHHDSGAPALQDWLTGLCTRRHFDELLRRDWAVAAREERAIALLLFDIDYFAQYNETFGRNAADSCLRLVGRAIAGALRQGSDIVARIGGEEFAALVLGVDEQAARSLGERIRARVQQLCIHHPRSKAGKYVTVSAGVVSAMPDAEAGPERLMQAAEAAVGQAKSAGRDRLVVGAYRPG